MLRGLLLGVSWGGLVAVAAVTTVSLVSSNANRAAVADQAQTAGLAKNPNATTGSDVDTAPAVGAVTAPVQGAAQPQSGDGEANLSATDSAQVATDAPTSPAMSDSEEPPADSDIEAHTAPDVTIPSGGGDAVVTSEEDAQTLNPNDAPPSPTTSVALPAAPQPETQPKADTQTDAMTASVMQEAPAEGDAAPTELPQQSDAPDVQPSALPQITPLDQAQSPQSDAGLTVPASTQPPVSQTPEGSAPESAAPATDEQFDTARASVPKITNLAPNVKTNRLPTIGGNTEAEVVEAGQETTAEVDERALVNYAMAFENPDAKPMFSVVLIDDPQSPVSDDVLSHLPFPLSFAIDAVRDDAYKAAARYRAAGFEVLMLTNLPFGANATDIEVAFGAYSRAIPDAVAVLDLGANGFLRGPSTATQIAGIMSEKGFGLITPSKGLNSAQKAAMREGVPAALVFRELDSDGEKPSVIRRYLDRAAFRAAQEGSVIMLGHTRSDTIEALVTWALEDRAASVAIAPVSAVLLAQ